MNGKQNYLLEYRCNMEESGAFGVTLMLSSFGGSIWLLWSSTQPQGRIIERANRFQIKKTPLNGHKLGQKPHRKEETHNLTEVHQFLVKSFHIRRLQKQLLFLPYSSLYFECCSTVPVVIILSLGFLWLNTLFFLGLKSLFSALQYRFVWAWS